MTKTNAPDAKVRSRSISCDSSEPFALFTGKWKIEIVCILVEGPIRFGELRRRLPGITQHMLTEQLRDLANNGIVIRNAFAEIPPRVEYESSQAGIDLMPTLREMRDWMLKYEHQLACSDRSAGQEETVGTKAAVDLIR